MAATKFLNRVFQNVSGTPGTGSITLGTAVSPVHFTAAEAGGVNGDVVGYILVDGSNVEIGFGTLSSSATVLSRDTVVASKIAGVAGTTKITASSAATVFLDVEAGDFPGVALIASDEFTGNGTTDYVLTNVPLGKTSMIVITGNGALQPPSTFTLSGKTLTLGGVVNSPDKVFVHYFVANPTAIGVQRLYSNDNTGSLGTGPYPWPSNVVPTAIEQFDVWVGGAIQRKNGTDYTWNSSGVTLSVSPSGDPVEIMIYQPVGIANAVPLDGSVAMTGDLTVAKASPNIFINKAASGQNAIVGGKNAGVKRWDWVLGNSTSESGSNVGSDAELAAYNDAGTFLYSPISIRRSTGEITVSQGQITFPASQNASAGANTLDDYEEGTWTPTVTAASGSFTSVSGTGKYTKVGNSVGTHENITDTTNGTAGTFTLFTLPFTSAISAGGAGREVNAVGYALTAAIQTGVSATQGLFKRYDNTYIGSDGYGFVISIAYSI